MSENAALMEILRELISTFTFRLFSKLKYKVCAISHTHTKFFFPLAYVFTPTIKQRYEYDN